MSAAPYRGKYPYRLRSISIGRQGMFATSNAGECLQLDKRLVAAAYGGRIPPLSTDVRELRAYVERFAKGTV